MKDNLVQCEQRQSNIYINNSGGIDQVYSAGLAFDDVVDYKQNNL
jgi:hypothetical protein